MSLVQWSNRLPVGPSVWSRPPLNVVWVIGCYSHCHSHSHLCMELSTCDQTTQDGCWYRFWTGSVVRLRTSMATWYQIIVPEQPTNCWCHLKVSHLFSCPLWVLVLVLALVSAGVLALVLLLFLRCVLLLMARLSTFSTSSYRYAGFTSSRKLKSCSSHTNVRGSVGSTSE